MSRTRVGMVIEKLLTDEDCASDLRSTGWRRSRTLPARFRAHTRRDRPFSRTDARLWFLGDQVRRMTAVKMTARSTTATPPHSFENTRTVCHHAPRATHVDRPAARAHNGNLQISAGFVANGLTKRIESDCATRGHHLCPLPSRAQPVLRYRSPTDPARNAGARIACGVIRSRHQDTASPRGPTCTLFTVPFSDLCSRPCSRWSRHRFWLRLQKNNQPAPV